MPGFEGDAFIAKCLFNEVLDFIKCDLRIGRGAKAILIGYDDEVKVGFVLYQSEAGEDMGHKFELLKTIYLLIGRFTHESAVAIDKERLFHRNMGMDTTIIVDWKK